MRFESHHEVLLDRTGPAFERAVDDTLTAARREVRSRTGTFARSLRRSDIAQVEDRLETVIGSPLASARVKERGGYIRAKRGPYLVIPQRDGSFRKVEAVRVPPTPVLSVAGPTFPEHMAARLREGLR